MSRHTTQKPLEEEKAQQYINWLRHNSRLLVVALIAVGAAVLGTYLYVRSAQIREVRAQQAFDRADQSMLSGNIEEGKTGMRAVLERYGSTNAGAMAAMKLATALIREANYAEAIGVLRDAQGSADKAVFGSALKGLEAAALADSGAYQASAAAYQEAAQLATFDQEKDNLRVRAAETYALAGDRERAAEIWRSFAGDLASPLAPRARRELGELMAAPAAGGGGQG